MTIKYNGHDLQKRMYNGQEVQKVMYGSTQIRPSSTPSGSIVLDFAASEYSGATWDETNPYGSRGYTQGRGYYFISDAAGVYRAKSLLLSSSISGTGTLTNIHERCQMPENTSPGVMTNNWVCRYPYVHTSSAIVVFDRYTLEAYTDSIDMTLRSETDIELDINFDYANNVIYGDVNGHSFSMNATQSILDAWNLAWHSGTMRLHFTSWGVLTPLYISKISFTEI